MSNFDPNAAASQNSGIFGFISSIEESALVIISAPWEATCSYGKGTSDAPECIFEASKFVELFDNELGDFFSKGIAYLDLGADIKNKGKKAQKLAAPIIQNGGIIHCKKLSTNKLQVDLMCEEMNSKTEQSVSNQLKNGKIVGLIGGEHSISLGAIRAFIKKFPEMGVIQIDAHADLRDSFESLKYSHASVMNNVLNMTKLKKLVQVGVRGYCQEEAEKIAFLKGRVVTYFESDISAQVCSSVTWDAICIDIVRQLPEYVYISLDVDGLEPSNCPNAGTPVPGGLTYREATHLMKKIAKSGKKIVGFDLVEVSCGKLGANSWDAKLAAHLLYKLCGFCLTSNTQKHDS